MIHKQLFCSPRYSFFIWDTPVVYKRKFFFSLSRLSRDKAHLPCERRFAQRRDKTRRTVRDFKAFVQRTRAIAFSQL